MIAGEHVTCQLPGRRRREELEGIHEIGRWQPGRHLPQIEALLPSAGWADHGPEQPQVETRAAWAMALLVIGSAGSPLRAETDTL